MFEIDDIQTFKIELITIGDHQFYGYVKHH